MLSKRVCKSCRDRYWRVHWGDVLGDEESWGRGYVMCKAHPVLRVRIDGDPPAGCPYRLEHVVDAE